MCAETRLGHFRLAVRPLDFLVCKRASFLFSRSRALRALRFLETLIDREGHEFELPRGHTLDLFRGGVTYTVLGCPGAGGSLFTVREIEQRGDALVVRLSGEVGRSGLRRSRRVPEPTGYPFPS